MSRNVTSELLDPALLFDEDVLGAVDHDVGDALFLQQDLERAEAERFVEDLFDQPLALGAVEQRVLGVAQVLDDEADLAAERVAFELAEARQVELVDQLAVDQPLQLFEFVLGRFDTTVPGCEEGWEASCCCFWQIADEGRVPNGPQNATSPVRDGQRRHERPPRRAQARIPPGSSGTVAQKSGCCGKELSCDARTRREQGGGNERI